MGKACAKVQHDTLEELKEDPCLRYTGAATSLTIHLNSCMKNLLRCCHMPSTESSSSVLELTVWKGDRITGICAEVRDLGLIGVHAGGAKTQTWKVKVAGRFKVSLEG